MDASVEIFDCTENCSDVVVIEGAGGLTASGDGDVLAPDSFGATGSISLGNVGAVVALTSGPGDRDLSRTIGDPRMASGTDLGLGIAVEGAAVPESSETGLVFRIGVTVVCEDTELSLVYADVEPCEDMEPSGAFSEVRCDDSGLRSGPFDSLLFFPNGQEC
jgi:hypothetical protein